MRRKVAILSPAIRMPGKVFAQKTEKLTVPGVSSPVLFSPEVPSVGFLLAEVPSESGEEEVPPAVKPTPRVLLISDAELAEFPALALLSPHTAGSTTSSAIATGCISSSGRASVSFGTLNVFH